MNKDLRKVNKKTRFSKTSQPKGKRGRKKGQRLFSSILKEYTEKKLKKENFITNEEESKKIIDWVALKLIAKAIEGDNVSMRELLDRMEGTAKQTIKIEDDSENKIDVKEATKIYLELIKDKKK